MAFQERQRWRILVEQTGVWPGPGSHLAGLDGVHDDVAALLPHLLHKHWGPEGQSGRGDHTTCDNTYECLTLPFLLGGSTGESSVWFPTADSA